MYSGWQQRGTIFNDGFILTLFILFSLTAFFTFAGLARKATFDSAACSISAIYSSVIYRTQYIIGQ
ncbi:hypothetical protein CS542_10260 [Pedobacter sp. IW39]|nr:hypothetical protein CS542_10260 [Pedobacter sp. IW39]